jgi:hypothetical protein
MSAVTAAAVISLGALLGAAAPPQAPKPARVAPAAPGAPPQPAAPAEAAGPQRAVFLFNLSDFHGDVKGGFLRLAYDRPRDEVYVWGGPDVLVFGDTGMEIYRFGEAQGAGNVRALAPLAGGDLVAAISGEDGTRVVRCNYRGEVTGAIPFSGFPAGVAPGTDEIRAVGGRLYFMDLRALRLVATDEQGHYLFHRDLAKAVFRDVGPDADPSSTQDNDITGFDVDHQGNVLLTIATQFRALVVSPELQARAFGGKGSRAGKFNIAGAVARDEAGNTYVADTLRSVIMVFSPDLRFLFEFGGRGVRPGRLNLPFGLVVGNGKVFVSQGANRPISVFKIE